MMQLTVTTVSSTDELQQILDLQQLYLTGQTDSAEEKDQGFLTVKHSYNMLQQIHELSPSVIVKDGDKVIAYALVMTKDCQHFIPVLVPMFESFNNIQFKEQPLSSYSFYVMGQVCVHKDYRGMGIFQMLYQHHQLLFSKQFDFVLTEISTRNARSIRAHEKVGFKTIYTFRDTTDEWAIVLWDWV